MDKTFVIVIAVCCYILAFVIIFLGFFPDSLGFSKSFLLIPCFMIAFILVLLGQLATGVADIRNDLGKISLLAETNTEIVRKHIEIQTQLMSVMAQNAGVDKALLNSILTEVNMEIPDDKKDGDLFSA